MRAVARVGLAALLGCALVGLRHPIPTTFALFQSSTVSPSNTFLSLEVQPATLTSASSKVAGGVRLVWTASPTAGTESVTYGILRRPTGVGAFAQFATTSALTYDDAPADGRYDYAVRAAVTTFTADSGALTAWSDGTAPTAAAVFASTGAVNGSVNLNWMAGTDATSGVAGYTIRWVQATTCPAASPAAYPSSTSVGVVTSTTVSGLTRGKKYCFYMITADVVGNQSGASNVSQATAK